MTNRPKTPNQQNAQIYSLDIHITISNFTVPRASARKGPSSGTQIKVTPHKTELATFVQGCRGVNDSSSQNVDISLYSNCMNMLHLHTEYIGSSVQALLVR